MNIRPHYILILICIAMIALVYTGPNLTFDDYNYLLYAKQILNNTFTYNQSPFAYGYVLPTTVAGSIILFGNFTSYASSIPAIIEYIALILIIYFTSLKLSNTKIAFSVAIIGATSAFIVAYSSRILPDLLAGDIIGIAIYLLINPDMFANWTFLFSGLLTGFLIFVKLGTLSIAIPIALILLLGKTTRTQFPIYLVGIALMVAIYLATISFNLSIFHNYVANQIALDQTDFYTNVITMLALAIPFLAVTGDKIFWQVFPLGMLFIYGLIGGYIAFLKKEWIYARWFLVIVIGFIYLLFGSESFTSYIPITVVSRYFIILAVPMAILATRFLNGIYDFIRYKYRISTADIILVSLVLIAIVVQFPMLWYFHSFTPAYVGAPI